jgi:putative oxidoreductase
MDQDAYDLGLLLMRLTLGIVLALHGIAKYRGGIAGVGKWFTSEGLTPVEIGAGLGLAAGFFTPITAMAYVGVMSVAGWVGHRDKGFFVIRNGWEYTFVLASLAACLALLGSGKYSLDNLMGIEWSGTGWFAVTLGGGVLSAVLLLLVFYRPPAKAE